MNSPLRPEVEKAFAAALELPRAEQGPFWRASTRTIPTCERKSNLSGPLIEPPV
jgi:hypothetical protein